ncbi:AEC family transporter [Thioalkalivibrio sp. HK1]|uniref:AEC family transporter n=1 Tax=Thioalkalivibrio sp. HK1 TaxID=1469245 RepID=UPI000472EDD8|nr:AEC family transporter [Thioalkalivibrio sp. HK1]
MYAIFIETLPFFAIIGLGYLSGRSGFFSEEATDCLTRFVFYFALSAMIFRFSSNLSIEDILQWNFVAAYLCASISVYALALIVARLRGIRIEEAVIEAQCSVVGNVGFLGIPMLSLLMGEAAVGYIMIVLAMDLLVFGTLAVSVIIARRDGRMSLSLGRVLLAGLLRNPMIMSLTIGLLWSTWNLSIPGPVDEFMTLLGAAATPGALFAIGASLASKSTERIEVAGWLSFCKLILHPAAVAFFALAVFPVEIFSAAVMIALASLPVAGNIYIIAQHYKVAPQRVSASILLSTVFGIVSVSLIIAQAETLYR